MQVAQGVALVAAKGWGAPETTDAFARARELCTLTGNISYLPMINWGEQVGHLLRCPLNVALQKAEEMLHQAQNSQDVTALLMAHRGVGITSIHVGHLEAARTHLERALSLYDADTHRELAHRFGYDARVAIVAYIVSVIVRPHGGELGGTVLMI